MNASRLPRAVRPRDAATLILVCHGAEGPRVLMGQRHAKHRFMPNKFVFPGGRVDPGDSRIVALRDLKPTVEARLREGCSATRARALGLAAIRETFEETGLRLGQPNRGLPRTRARGWTRFASGGLVPTLEVLELVARAVTPPHEPLRFDTRFFMADAEHIQGGARHPLGGSGELVDLRWIPLAEAPALDLPDVTRFVLGEIERRLSASQRERETLAVPFVHYRRTRAVVEYL